MSSTTTFLVAAGIIAAVSIPLIANAVPPNRFYGFRTQRTLSNEKVWYRVNRFAGWALLIAAILSATVLAVVPEQGPAAPGYAAGIFVVPILIALAASYFYLRSIGDK